MTDNHGGTPLQQCLFDGSEAVLSIELELPEMGASNKLHSMLLARWGVKVAERLLELARRTQQHLVLGGEEDSRKRTRCGVYTLHY